MVDRGQGIPCHTPPDDASSSLQKLSDCSENCVRLTLEHNWCSSLENFQLLLEMKCDSIEVEEICKNARNLTILDIAEII